MGLRPPFQFVQIRGTPRRGDSELRSGNDLVEANSHFNLAIIWHPSPPVLCELVKRKAARAAAFILKLSVVREEVLRVLILGNTREFQHDFF